MSKKGVSDILGVLPGGRALAIEVKNSNGKATEHQRQFLEDVARAGGLSFIARSVEDVRHELEKVGIIPPQGMLF